MTAEELLDTHSVSVIPKIRLVKHPVIKKWVLYYGQFGDSSCTYSSFQQAVWDLDRVMAFTFRHGRVCLRHNFARSEVSQYERGVQLCGRVL